MKKQFLFLSVLILSLGGIQVTQAAPKKFKRALIIAGGGITPGIGLGIIDGAQKMGWNPDVVITTCGASIGSSIRAGLSSNEESLNYMKGQEFFNLMSQIRIQTSSVFSLKSNFDKAKANPGISNYFSGNVLYMDDVISSSMSNKRFEATPGQPRFIVLAAKANFGPQNVGQLMNANRFTQVFFTDADTAKFLNKQESFVKRLFPQSFLSPMAAPISDKALDQAARASIADPFLINPGNINGQYYFTGAVDLIPLELGHDLADEVLVTFPAALFTDYENVAIQSTFGFNQTQRVLHAIQDQNVKWIDISGNDKFSFDPGPSFLSIENRIPSQYGDFTQKIQKQYEFGFARVQEALTVQANAVNVRSHLRKPISPKLLQNFSCYNAYEWRTAHNPHCESDGWPGCNRQSEDTCVPLR